MDHEVKNMYYEKDNVYTFSLGYVAVKPYISLVEYLVVLALSLKMIANFKTHAGK